MSGRSTTQITSGFAPGRAAAAQASGVLQRKCASCGNHTMAGGKCEECEKKGGMLQRKSNGYSESSGVPPVVHEVLNSPGQPLDAGTRAFMEPRFGHDFNGVRVHTDAKAAESARALNALAYTVGKDVVFEAGQYAPGTSQGRQLLAHELAHHLQQQTMGPRVQRKLVVNPNHPTSAPVSAPATDPAASLTTTQRFSMMDSLIQSLCNEFEVEGSSGEVMAKSRTSPDRTQLATGATPTGCCCLAVLTDSLTNTWTIDVSQVLGPHTIFGSRHVILSPTTTPVEFGSFTGAGALAFQGQVPAAGHELCGHAALDELSAHPPPGQDRLTTDVHDPTVRIENLISSEQGVPASELRGLAASSSHRGESVDRITVRKYPLNGSDVGGLPPPERAKLDFAADYAKANNGWVDILGFSDSVGSTSAKQHISEARASKAKAALNARGVTDTITKHGLTSVPRFTRVEGLSDSQPPPAPLAVDDANWRRVEILIAGFPAGAQVPPTGTPTTVTPHTPAATVPSLKSSPDPCVARLVGGANP